MCVCVCVRVCVCVCVCAPLPPSPQVDVWKYEVQKLNKRMAEETHSRMYGDKFGEHRPTDAYAHTHTLTLNPHARNTRRAHVHATRALAYIAHPHTHMFTHSVWTPLYHLSVNARTHACSFGAYSACAQFHTRVLSCPFSPSDCCFARMCEWQFDGVAVAACVCACVHSPTVAECV